MQTTKTKGFLQNVGSSVLTGQETSWDEVFQELHKCGFGAGTQFGPLVNAFSGTI